MTRLVAPAGERSCVLTGIPQLCSLRVIRAVLPDDGDFRTIPVNGHSQDRRACLKVANAGHPGSHSSRLRTGRQSGRRRVPTADRAAGPVSHADLLYPLAGVKPPTPGPSSVSGFNHFETLCILDAIS
jgi:hypothetical protein